MMEKMTIGVFLILLWASCSEQQSTDLPDHLQDLENLTVYSSDVIPEYQIHLEREQTFGDTDEVYFGRLTDVVVDKSGRTYIADGDELNIKVFEADGRFVTQLGREGRGPGEFVNIWYLQIKANRLFAYDGTQRRSVVFSLDSLSYSYTVNFGDDMDDVDELLSAFPARYYVRNDGTFLMGFTKVSHTEKMNENWHRVENTGLYFLLNEHGRIISERLFELKANIDVSFQRQSMNMWINPSYYGKSLVALSDDDHIYTAWSEDFMIMVYGPDGDYRHAFYYPYEKVTLTEDEAINTESSEFFQQGMQLMELPPTWPVLNELLVDDEHRLWFSTIVEDDEFYEWWVLRNTGELIAKFTWPRDQPIQTVNGGFLYTRETEEETGLQQIVKYRMDLNM